ncbi:hypothetical protein [Allorhodopirellula solitaria]|uniref:Uncharacterized protein n=1 Tax=Allorhodopirellula solitaria TaxID=2527987 RepID=A0A5C5XWL2_9BACT|nr:hypothetical protein [Allorhodopirellula solitaria]TWT67058.1 hypothetical protein CA85_19040 [Allorhodopirellula solitaria]
MVKQFLSILFAGGLFVMTTGCDVEKTSEGRLPDVDVDVSGDPGAVPSYDVDAPDVDVSTEEEQVTVPDVDISTEEKTMEVPNVDIDLPADE